MSDETTTPEAVSHAYPWLRLLKVLLAIVASALTIAKLLGAL